MQSSWLQKIPSRELGLTRGQRAESVASRSSGTASRLGRQQHFEGESGSSESIATSVIVSSIGCANVMSWPDATALQLFNTQQNSGNEAAVISGLAKCRRADLRCRTATIERPPASSGEADGPTDEKYDWKKAWFPVAIEVELPEDRPTAVRLLGEPIVLWKDSQKQWRAFKDLCPHRYSAEASVSTVQRFPCCCYDNFESFFSLPGIRASLRCTVQAFVIGRAKLLSLINFFNSLQVGATLGRSCRKRRAHVQVEMLTSASASSISAKDISKV